MFYKYTKNNSSWTNLNEKFSTGVTLSVNARPQFFDE